nr:hypothetical protein [Eubacterium sp.]
MKKIITVILVVSLITTSMITVGADAVKKYDLRDYGRVTTVKSQVPREFCWAFATIASLESNLITKGIVNKNIDLSEAHLGYFALHGKSSATLSKYAGKDTCASADDRTNFYNSVTGLARGYGAVYESDMPYSLMSKEELDAKYTTESLMTKSVFELTSANFIKANNTVEKYDSNAVNKVKNWIRNKGAVASKIDFPDPYEWKKVFGTTKPNEMTSYYDEEVFANHAVTIIGWDDDFYDYKSENKPAGKGAWIIKDSYSEKMHGTGCFYVSYYTPSMSQFMSLEGQKNSGRQTYQYDGVGFGDFIVMNDSQVSGTNSFVARGDVLLDQVGVYTPSNNCSVNIKIYVTQNSDSPLSGTKLYDKTFSKEYLGYSKLNLGKKIGISKGARFSISVTIKDANNKYFVPFEIESLDSPINDPARVNSGESYVKFSGKSIGIATGKWKAIDFTSKINYESEQYRLHNALVKGFGYKGGTKKQKIKVKTKR